MPIIYLSPSTQELNAVCPCGQGTPVGLEGGESAHMSRTRHFCRFCGISCNFVALVRYIW